MKLRIYFYNIVKIDQIPRKEDRNYPRNNGQKHEKQTSWDTPATLCVQTLNQADQSTLKIAKELHTIKKLNIRIWDFFWSLKEQTYQT